VLLLRGECGGHRGARQVPRRARRGGVDLEAGAVRLEEFDAPDRWQLAERADADREVARTRGERWRERRDQRRRQALADELAGLKRRATEIKEEMSAIG
jgi:hypothetical protein